MVALGSGEEVEKFYKMQKELEALDDRVEVLKVEKGVMVNRIWQYHFGAGIVQTPNDFGARGRAPTHPELFDYLASRFIEGGWSLKKMHRMIMQAFISCNSA